MKKIKNLLSRRKHRNQRVYSHSSFNDADIDRERIEALYGDFHHDCGDRD